MYRFFDLFFSALGIIFLFPVFIILILLGFLDSKKPIFAQERVGKDMRPFILYKFRTMKEGTKSVATHLATSKDVTAYGSFLRKTKLDEIPQLINVLMGDMSLVGPRPNLFNQDELIEVRKANGVYDVRPGITGLAQTNGIDMSNPNKLAEVDALMIKEMSVKNYFKFLLLTVFGRGLGDCIRT